MEIIGVSKTRPTAEALVAVKKGYPVYIADISKKADFEKAGIPVAGSIEEMVQKADVIVDGTPGGVGESNKALYEKYNKKAIWQGGEKHNLAGFSFNAHANYKDAIGRQFVRVVSCVITSYSIHYTKLYDDRDRQPHRQGGWAEEVLDGAGGKEPVRRLLVCMGIEGETS